jgi:hypothetical protein
MIERFQYNASAVGAGGRIVVPFEEIIPIQASSALPETGGFGTARVERFQFRDIFSFHAASSVVSGAYNKGNKSFDTLATVSIEGLNLLGVVTADRIVARLSSTYSEDGKEHSITPVGSSFENLRIAGCPVKPRLATDTFSQHDTFDKVKVAYRENLDHFRDEFNRLSLIGRGDSVPEKIRKHLPWCGLTEGKEIPETNGVIACSLVRELEGLGPEVKEYGHIIYVPGFGSVRLAELKITKCASRVTMLQVELGSPTAGNATAGGVETNGSPW